MLFKYITKHREGKIFELTICVLIFAFVLTINGCVTTETYRIPKEKLSTEVDYQIVRVLMKDGSVIELRNKYPRYYDDYKDREKVIVYLQQDSAKVSENAARITSNEKIIDLNDVFSIIIEREEVNVTNTVLLSLAIAAGIALIVVAASGSGDPYTPPPPPPSGGQIMSCPYVYSFNGSEFRLESETFAGAILKTAERTAYDNLYQLQPEDKQIILKLTNEMPETEYTNELKVMAVDSKNIEKVIPDYKGTIHTISSQIPPNICTDFAGNDMRNLVLTSDNYMWRSDLMNMDVSKDENLKDGLILEFSKPENADLTKIVVNGINTDLTVAAFKEIIGLQGKSKTDWVQRLENDPVETQRLVNFLKREGMLHIKLWINNEWVEQNIIPDPGPVVSKEQVAMLNISQIKGKTFKVKLESTTDLWKIDQVYVDYSKDNNVITNELNIISAVNQDGKIVKEVLAANDDKYLTSTPGDYTVICYENIPLRDGMQRHYILKSKGYYHPWFQSDENKNEVLYDKIMDEPLYGLKYYMNRWKLESVR